MTDRIREEQDLQFTLRQLHACARNPRLWTALLAIGLAVGLTGPFETFTMPLGSRLAYWLIVTVATGYLGLSVNFWMMHRATALPGFLHTLLTAVLIAVPVTAFVLLMDAAFSRLDSLAASEILVLGLYCAGISLAVLVVVNWVLFRPQAVQTPDAPVVPAGLEQAAPERDAPERAPAAPFLRRLPPRLGGELIRLATQDHYLEAATPLGRTLVLMRMGDAVDELAGVEGLRIHRSFWVSRAGAAGLWRSEGRLFVKTVEGELLPVSRSYLPAVRQTPWLRELGSA